MPQITFRMLVDTKKLEKLQAELVPKVAAHIAKTAFDFQTEAQVNAPVDTGALKSSIIAEQKQQMFWLVSTDKEYAIYQEFGTGPFLINAPVFIRKVGWRYITMHPGVPAHPFFTPAYQKNLQPFLDGFSRIVNV